jgi:hypothetical protein
MKMAMDILRIFCASKLTSWLSKGDARCNPGRSVSRPWKCGGAYGDGEGALLDGPLLDGKRGLAGVCSLPSLGRCWACAACANIITTSPAA